MFAVRSAGFGIIGSPSCKNRIRITARFVNKLRN